jgi:hypothetical protein
LIAIAGPYPRVLVAAPLLAVALAGCGKSEIDRGKAEEFVRGTFTPEARSASCPKGVEAKKGKTFACTAVDTSGKRFRVTLHIQDANGRVDVGPNDTVPAP